MAGAIVFFLVDAAQLLLLVPGRSAELFAWPIAPDSSAYVLAAAYVAGGYFFVRVALGAPWDAVAAGFAPGDGVRVDGGGRDRCCTSTSFRDDSLPFAAWALLYAAAPFGIPVAGRARRRARWAPAAAGEPLPQRGCASRWAPSARRWWPPRCGVFAAPGSVDRRLAVADDAADHAHHDGGDRAVRLRVGRRSAIDGRRAAATIVLEALAVGLGDAARHRGGRRGGHRLGPPLAPVLVGGTAVALLATVAVRVTQVRGGATRGVVMR